MRKLSFAVMLVAVVAVFSASRLVAEDQKPAEKAAIGQKAPAFTLKDLDGKEVSLSDYAGKIVVLEWINPECPFVVRHYDAKTMTTLADKYKDKDVVWLAIATGETAKVELNKPFVNKHGAKYPVLLDPEGTTARAYDAKTTPHMYIIDKQGALVYRGGIDDDPSGNKADKTHYVDKALSQVVAGESVTQAETRPYGCSLKFK